MMQMAINILGTVTVGVCAVLLLRSYVSVKRGLLLWSGLCFAGLTLANALVFIDLSVIPEVSLYRWRLGVAAASILVLVYGLVFDSE